MGLQSICKLCHQERELCQSHIVPEFLYKPLYNDKHFATKIRVDEGISGKQRSGYKEPLLCLECETRFNAKFETPLSQIWPGLLPERIRPGEVHSIQVDYSLLKLFLLSVLWRAGVAGGSQWLAINLGSKHSERLRTRLLNEEPGAPEDYPVGGFITCQGGEPSPFYSTPTRRKSAGIRVYVFYFGGFSWHFVVGSHLPRHIASLPIIRPGDRHPFVARSWEDLFHQAGLPQTWQQAVHPRDRAKGKAPGQQSAKD